MCLSSFDLKLWGKFTNTENQEILWYGEYIKYRAWSGTFTDTKKFYLLQTQISKCSWFIWYRIVLENFKIQKFGINFRVLHKIVWPYPDLNRSAAEKTARRSAYFKTSMCQEMHPCNTYYKCQKMNHIGPRDPPCLCMARI